MAGRRLVLKEWNGAVLPASPYLGIRTRAVEMRIFGHAAYRRFSRGGKQKEQNSNKILTARCQEVCARADHILRFGRFWC